MADAPQPPARKRWPLPPDVWVSWIATGGLVLIGMASAVGTIWCALIGRDTPPLVTAMATTALGALSAVAVRHTPGRPFPVNGHGDPVEEPQR